MTTLSTYRTLLLDLLDDYDQDRYVDDTLDSALRLALADLDQTFPVERSQIVDATGQNRIALDDDFTAIIISRIEHYNEDNPNITELLAFTSSLQDGTWVIELDTALSNTEDIEIFYTTPNTIEGLDTASTTTLPSRLVNPFLRAAAGYAVQIRAQAISENNNLVDSTPATLAALANTWIDDFRTLLNQATRRGSFIHWPTTDLFTNH
jgi:hypothetical protein